jgi:EAL domain-containing protein (putative c-di-GMP-specific phosphodiesterase class I)
MPRASAPGRPSRPSGPDQDPTSPSTISAPASSPASLQQFSIDTIKIDRAFTGALNGSGESGALIHSLVQRGRPLGLNTVAEGIETIEQLDGLHGEHVDELQGFVLSKRLDAAAIEALIMHHPASLNTGTI